MDFDLTDEQHLIRETARDFARDEVMPRARDNDRNDHFDLELVGKIADQGYLGAIVPREYGGAGLDYLTYGLIVEEVGRRLRDAHGDLGADLARVLVDPALGHRGAEAQLPARSSARGEWLGCFGLTEPDTGSDAANQRTRATKTDGGWRINGAKMWISMGNHAKVALVFAQTDPEQGHAAWPASSSTPTSPASSRQRSTARWACTASDTASISLDDVEVADDDLLGEVGDGFKVAMSALDSGPLLRGRRLRRGSARAAWTSRSATPRSASSSAGRSPPSSSCRR